MVKEKIENLIKKSIKRLQEKREFPKFEIPAFEIEYPKEKRHGDYATNLALILGKKLKRYPIKIGDLIKSQIPLNTFFERIEVVEPGFINFFLSKGFLRKKLFEILKKRENFGKLKIGRNKKLQVEFISANPTGPLHIGNGRGAFFGDTLAKILERVGYNVEREYYINNGKFNNQIISLGKTAMREGKAYLNDYLKEKIKILDSKIKNYERKILNREKLYQEVGFLVAREIQKDIKFFIEKKLKIKFDNWFSEEGLYKKSKIKKVFEFLKRRNLVYQKEGAWWVKTSQFGEEKDWVVIKSEKEGKTPTYLLSDIAYHKDKFERGFKKIINIWGADHQAHVSKIKAVAKMLNYRGSLEILICQLVKLKTGKISKRKGEIVTLEGLINEVGLDVARFFYLSKSLNTQMDFDLELAKTHSEKNPVYYIQYAFARISSIIRKANFEELLEKLRPKDLEVLNEEKEISLMKKLIIFPEIIERTAKDYQVQRLCQYALEIAGLFHQFYQECQVLVDDLKLKRARLALVLATKVVLKNIFDLLGISAPERM